MPNPLESFIQEFFIRPALDPSVPGYNLVNTLVLGALLLLIAFGVVYKQLDKRGFKFNYEFVRALLPFILFGTSMRVLQDLGMLARSVNPFELGFYTYTPGIWLLTAFIVLLGMALSWGLEKKMKWRFTTTLTVIGLLAALPLFALVALQFQVWNGFLGILVLALGVTAGIILIANRFKPALLKCRLNRLALAGQMLDTSATFVALQFFRCGEQHVLPRMLFDAFGPASFFAVKIPLILLVLHYVDKEFEKPEQENLKNFTKLFIIVLGFAPGLRDLLTVAVGTCL
ncbi:MAG: DUF63 family protein [Candidatus Diapherotrites archaeon]|nr:DUF63 family protein [Candidatus Diapherotrites archaeon]